MPHCGQWRRYPASAVSSLAAQLEQKLRRSCQAIIERAHQHGVYVHESKELVALLMQVDLDQRIPPALYLAVAELLAWVYRLEKSGPASLSEIL